MDNMDNNNLVYMQSETLDNQNSSNNVYCLNDLYVVVDERGKLHLCQRAILDDYNMLGDETRVGYSGVLDSFNAIYKIGMHVHSLSEILTICGIGHIGYCREDELEDFWKQIRMALTGEVYVSAPRK